MRIREINNKQEKTPEIERRQLIEERIYSESKTAQPANPKDYFPQ